MTGNDAPSTCDDLVPSNKTSGLDFEVGWAPADVVDAGSKTEASPIGERIVPKLGQSAGKDQAVGSFMRL